MKLREETTFLQRTNTVNRQIAAMDALASQSQASQSQASQIQADQIQPSAAVDKALTGFESWRKLNLVYLVFVPLPLFIQSNRNISAWLATFVAIAVFLPIYWQHYAQKCDAALRSALLMALIGLALQIFQPGGASIVVYALAALGLHQKPRKAILVSAALLSATVLLSIARGYHWMSVLPLVLIAFAVLMGAIFGRREILRNAELRISRDEVVRHARNAERERISRDLHDLLGHTLSVIALKSELARKLMARDVDAAVLEIAEVERIARDSLAQVREAVTGMRTTEFSAELANARVTLLSAGLAVQLDIAFIALAPAQAQAFGLVLREAVTNILRHAKAHAVEIQLQQAAQIVLIVRDDGHGTPPTPGNGISGMRERLRALGGDLRIDSNTASAGTALFAYLPCVKQTAQALADSKSSQHLSAEAA